MKILIRDSKAKAVFFDNRFYDTNTEIETDFSTAIRLSRAFTVDYVPTRQSYDPTLFREEKKFGFVSDIDGASGWGNVSLNLLKYSKDYKIAAVGRMFNVTDPTVARAMSNTVEERGAMVWHEQPKGSWIMTAFPKNIAIVPFETTFIPLSWVSRINNFDALLVPCKQNIEAFRNSGVKIPIDLIHWGIDQTKFKPLERPDDGIFTFGHMGALSIRKGTDILQQAFKIAFPTEIDVRLINKTSQFGYHFWEKNDKRISVQMTPVTHEELMRDFFAQVDCFVFPTRGEGFGLTPLEAMATGIPSIVTGWSGPLEYMTPDVGWTIDYTMEPAHDFTNTIYKEDCGDWAKPSLDHLVQLMRYAYEHQDEVKQKGKNAAQHVLDNWTWDKKIGMYHEALNKHL